MAARVPWLEVTILALSIAVLVALAVANEQSNEAAIGNLDSFSSYDAKGGGYRGWFELLSREGVNVERFEFRPAFLDRSLQTLVWAEPLDFDPRQIASTETDVHALENWVRAGGRLVYIGHDDAAARQKLLGLPLTKTHRAPSLSIGPALAAYGVAKLAETSTLRYVPRKGMTVLAGNPRAALAVRYPYGRGSVTALVDESLFTNASLARADDARFAFALVALGGATGRVGFDEAVHGFEAPLNWWDLVPRALVISFLIGVAAVAIAIVGGAIRLGPPIVPVARADRGSGDFLDSVAALFARGKAVRKALDDAWSSTRRAAALSAGVPDDAPVQDIAARVEGSEVRADLLSLEALASDARPDDATLVRGVALAQRLRKEFITHGRTGR